MSPPDVPNIPNIHQMNFAKMAEFCGFQEAGGYPTPSAIRLRQGFGGM